MTLTIIGTDVENHSMLCIYVHGDSELLCNIWKWKDACNLWWVIKFLMGNIWVYPFYHSLNIHRLCRHGVFFVRSVCIDWVKYILFPNQNNCWARVQNQPVRVGNLTYVCGLLSKDESIFNQLRSLIFVWVITCIVAKLIAAVAYTIGLGVSIMPWNGIWLRSITIGVYAITATILIKFHIRSSYYVSVTLYVVLTLVLEEYFLCWCDCGWLPVISKKIVIFRCRPKAFVTCNNRPL